ncbi:MAG: hypothetical protein PHY47_08420 [Lachnospiraceae bacterium]|nr:hypothetical protein [Lachnospiraceae bacterium]
MEYRKDTGLQEFLMSVYIILLTPIVVGFATYLIKDSTTEVIRNVVICCIQSGILIYVIAGTNHADSYLFDNRDHLFRICISYTIALTISVFGALLPKYMVPLVAIGLIFALFSNFEIGICAYFLFSSILVMLSYSSFYEFIYYFLTGFFAIAIFYKGKDTFKIILPVINITWISIVTYMAVYFLQQFEITPEIIINPTVGIFCNALILFVSLHLIAKGIVYRNDDKYTEINDTEYQLLTQLKSFDKAEYYQAIHTAYLSDRIADKLSCDRKLAKAGGYYHKIGVLRGKNINVLNIEIGQEYLFPTELIHLLQEYSSASIVPTRKETIIVMMSDAIVTSILFLLKKEPDTPIEYDKVIEVVFKKKLEANVFKNTDLKLWEYYKMKDYFKEEKLYYDFLR